MVLIPTSSDYGPYLYIVSLSLLTPSKFGVPNFLVVYVYRRHKKKLGILKGWGVLGGSGDLVSTLITPITPITHGVALTIPIINLLFKSP